MEKEETLGKTRKEITKALSEMLERHMNPTNDTRIYTAKEVTFDYGKPGQCRVDYMRFCPVNNSVSGIEKGDVYCYEIKSCTNDFDSTHGHNLIGDYNYYVMPKETYEEVRPRMEYKAGVLCPENGELVTVRPAKRCDRTRPLVEILLMMFRSANREVIKAKTRKT